jgi:hypothetical protein
MRWFRRSGSARGTNGARVRGANGADRAHLEAFATSRRGVEAYIEPRTTVTETTVVLIADTGEWTRRRVPGPEAAYELARRLGIPVYEAAVVGYPARMREWNRRQKTAEA